jgi:hypothetical protein
MIRSAQTKYNTYTQLLWRYTPEYTTIIQLKIAIIRSSGNLNHTITWQA